MSILKGRYELREKLGEGGMAEVYRAVQLTLDREVAIKFIKQTLTGDPQFALRFEREAKAIARLSHPNIMHVYDFDQAEDERYFMVMELLRGYPLADELKSRKATDDLFALTDAITITRTVADALAYAHQHDVLHRDVKPHNIFLTDDNRIVVTDFGIAKIISEGQLTETGTTIGTPHYFAPEQGYGKPTDHRADIYALTVVFYEILTGQVPYDADSMLGIIAQHANAPIPDPREKRSDLPVEVTQIILSGMAKSPDDRYQSMTDFMRDLDSLRQESPTEAGTIRVQYYNPNITADQTIPVPPDTAAPTTVDTPAHFPTLSRSSSSRLPLIIGAVVLLLVVLLGGFIFMNGDQDDPAPTQSAQNNLSANNTPPIEPAAEGEYMMLVANVQGDEDLGINIEDRIANTLRAGSSASTLRENFRLEQVNVDITDDTDLQALAEQTGALIIIWGDNTPLGLEIKGQAFGYPDDTIQKMGFLVPSGDDFNSALVTDMPIAVDVISTSLITQEVLRRGQFIPLLEMNLLVRDSVADADLRIVPDTPVDSNLFAVWSTFGRSELEASDAAATAILAVLPNDPTILFIRWASNAMFLERYERAKTDARKLEEVLPNTPIGAYAYTSTLFFEGDYDTLITETDTLLNEYPDYAYTAALYRELALLRQGNFSQIMEEVNGLTDSFDLAPEYPSMYPFRAMLYEIQGDNESAVADIEVLQNSRLLESTSGMFLDPSLVGENAELLLFGGYVVEANGDLVTSALGYQFGLVAEPDNFLLLWRRGVVAEKAQDYQQAYDRYLAAKQNAPVPFPIALYQAAALVHSHADALDNPQDACTLLTQAREHANTNPNFYALLLEKINTAHEEWSCQ